MKKLFFVQIPALMIIFLAGCMSRYTIMNEAPSGFSAAKYSNIHVGWLDLDESKWKDYRYESVDKWKVTIREMNVLGLQKFLKDLLPGRTITGDAEKTGNFPANGDLYIKSTLMEIEEHRNFGINLIPRTITVKVQFYDVQTKQELYSSTVNATRVGAQWTTVEARLDAIVFNYAKYLAGKLAE
ncbi:MAG: hypothetical protein JXN64_10260 [Spirochaetes bacterium]|nr:hypothetical protein [Spirochaetota bacterium]